MSDLSTLVPLRIRNLRKERGWTMAELATRVDTTASTIAKIEHVDRVISLPWIERLAAGFGISTAELLGTVDQSITPTRMIPLVGDIAAGNWREAIQNADGEVPAVGAGQNAFALRARGDSMDKLIPDGGYVIVEPTMTDLRDGKVYAVMNADGETTVKRFRSDPARLEPCSTNPSHETINLGRGPFSVVGQVSGAFMPL